MSEQPPPAYRGRVRSTSRLGAEVFRLRGECRGSPGQSEESRVETMNPLNLMARLPAFFIAFVACATLQAEADELAAEGRKGYVIPGGGSNPLGTLGYVSCAQEILGQAFQKGIQFDHLVCASGSGGTHSGILVGMRAMGSRIPVTGISVRRPVSEQEGLIGGLVTQTREFLDHPSGLVEGELKIFDDYVGPGYSIPTEEMAEAVRIFARVEGILLDPVYTGKAAAGLLDLIRKGYFGKGEKVLFLHTGGAPGLYAYQDVLLD